MGQINGIFALHWSVGTAALSGGFQNERLLNGWNSLWDEDEVDAYDHLTASTVETMDMDLDGPEYYIELGAPEAPMALPESATSDSSMRPQPWQSWYSTPRTALSPLLASTEASSGGTSASHRHRRRHSDSGVEFDALVRPQPGGLGRMLDQKRVRIDRWRSRRPTPSDRGATRRQRLQMTPRESHVNKSPPRSRRKAYGYRQLDLCLSRIEWLEPMPGLAAADGGWLGVTFWVAAAVGMANMQQVGGV
ncbi:hypothetical protein V2A60_003446 [Cordyceps javanica]|uniref:Uncharacterized protein n=1 Tax=Cordyceps javanica TaxID=43265 RepID=A0A545W0A2_9HYPO|nr:hypothetical protein IF1G_04688 [Cordyceps javanica]TQW07402.1 hypothetical protein IF2G_04563 [Cordyceps javanica]